GVKKSMSHRDFGVINKWLCHIKDIYRIHRAELDAMADQEQRSRRLVELNVTEQAWPVAETSFVQTAWHNGYPLCIHGWIYDLHTGYLNNLLLITRETQVDELYRLPHLTHEHGRIHG